MREDLEEVEFRDDSVRRIALHFEVPRRTASSWKRNIGDVDTLENKLGEHAPENYLDLIRRREWIPYEQNTLEEEWVTPLKQWCVRKTEGVYLKHASDTGNPFDKEQYFGSRSTGLGSGYRAVEPVKQISKERDSVDTRINWSEEMLELQNELERKEGQVRYEMKRFDSEWIGLAREHRQVEKKLIEIYEDYLREYREFLKCKKNEIQLLKWAFPYLRAGNDELVAEATDSSISYVAQFKATEDGEIVNHKTPKHLTRKVRERDSNECVRCGSGENLQFHHIIPRTKGGKNETENLATLCEQCHKLAHKGRQIEGSNKIEGMDYNEVAYSSVDDFWNNWVSTQP